MHPMKILFSAVLLMLVSACTVNDVHWPIMFQNDIKKAEALSQPAGSFNEYLRLEYINGFNMAKGSAGEGDWRSANIFLGKALQVGQGETVFPEHPDNWYVTDPRELRLARIELMSALVTGGREAAPQDAAIAQARYDCWVEEAKENFEPEDIAKCRDEFWDALRRVQAALAPKPAQAPPPEPAARDYLIYFDFDKTNIRPDAQGILELVLAAMGELGSNSVSLIGHADRSGSNEYNQGLSERRAESARQFLIDGGIPGAGIETMGRGEEDPRVPTPDGVREQENRNVQIRIN